MKAVIQRVNEASVVVDSDDIGDNGIAEPAGKTDDAASPGMGSGHDRYQTVQRRMINNQMHLLVSNRVKLPGVNLQLALVLFSGEHGNSRWNVTSK